MLALRPFLASLLFVPAIAAQTAPTPVPLANPTFPPTLSAPVPHLINAGPLGPLEVNAVAAAFGQLQSQPLPGDATGQAALSQGFLLVQKTTGWWGFYLQAGAYDLPALGTPFLSNRTTWNQLFGPLPVGYLKLNFGKNANLEAGVLPTLFGAEYTFGFQDLNIERGLLVNQENAVNRGLQFNDTFGKLSTSVSWNDGFYSNRFTWLTASANYAFNSAHALTIMLGGNLGHTDFKNLATPIQNNSRIVNLIYTYARGSWAISPYYQLTVVPTEAQTYGGAILVNYAFHHHVSISGRIEYIASVAGPTRANLLYGSGSRASSATITPSWQHGLLFTRGELSLVHATAVTPGDAFGPTGTRPSQFRATLETGLIF